MVPPKEVKGGDFLQDPITLDLLAVQKDRLQDFQAILLQEFHGGHVNLTPILGFGRQPIGILSKDTLVNLVVLEHGCKDGNTLGAVGQKASAAAAGNVAVLCLFQDPIEVFLGVAQLSLRKFRKESGGKETSQICMPQWA